MDMLESDTSVIQHQHNKQAKDNEVNRDNILLFTDANV